MLKVEVVVSNIPPKSNTYAHPLIPYPDHTFNRLNVSNAKEKRGGGSGECGVGYGKKWN
jgi:hypothetical protein